MKSIVVVRSNPSNMPSNRSKVPSSLERCLHKSQGIGYLCGGPWEMAGFLLTLFWKMVFFACVIRGKWFSDMVSDAKRTMLIFRNFLGAEPPEPPQTRASGTRALGYKGSANGNIICTIMDALDQNRLP